MVRKTRKIQDASSDDDAPEVVSRLASKADAKRNRKTLQAFEAEEKARRKARNQEKDRKLKERARATKSKKPRGVRFVDGAQALEGEGEDESDEDGDDVEARMLRAMREAANEMESDEEEDEEQSKGFQRGMDQDEDDDMASDSDSLFAQDEDSGDAEISEGESDIMDPEALTDDEEMDGDEGLASLRADIVQKPSRKTNYLADDLFAAAFASQSSKPHPEKSLETTQQTVKKRRRKASGRLKDLVIGGRTIRTLPRPSDPRSQATARSVPSARARRFVDESLALRGKRSLAKAKKKGWERRPVNIGVMKCQGAPHGFARSTR